MNDITIQFLRNVNGWKRGDIVTVQNDPFTENMVKNGFATVLSSTVPHPLEEPSLKASRAEWARFLEEQGVEIHPQASRRSLIDQWRGVENRG